MYVRNWVMGIGMGLDRITYSVVKENHAFFTAVWPMVISTETITTAITPNVSEVYD